MHAPLVLDQAEKPDAIALLFFPLDLPVTEGYSLSVVGNAPGSNQGNMHLAAFFVGWGLPHQVTIAPRNGGASPTLQIVTPGRRFLNQAEK